MDKEKRKYHREKYEKAFLEIRETINNIDPIGLIELCGPQEYDIEVAEILARIQDCNSSEEIRKMVIEVFTKYFDDPGSIEQYANVGNKLIAVKNAITN